MLELQLDAASRPSSPTDGTQKAVTWSAQDTHTLKTLKTHTRSLTDGPSVCVRYLSLELFIDEGLKWWVGRSFPELRPSASTLTIYDNLSLDCAALVAFVVETRDRPYSLLDWNCQTFVNKLKRVARERDSALHPCPPPA